MAVPLAQGPVARGAWHGPRWAGDLLAGRGGVIGVISSCKEPGAKHVDTESFSAAATSCLCALGWGRGCHL